MRVSPRGCFVEPQGYVTKQIVFERKCALVDDGVSLQCLCILRVKKADVNFYVSHADVASLVHPSICRFLKCLPRKGRKII